MSKLVQIEERARAGAPKSVNVDAEALAAELRANIRGEVRFDDGSRALYATDASNYRQVPIGVVVPLDAEDVVKTLAAARRFNAPVLARGGGTSLAGQCCNVAVVLDMSKYMNRIVELDPENKRARVEPGLIRDKLCAAAAPYKLTFAPDPSTHNHCTIGGMIGNNSCGVHSVMGGKTVDNIEEMEILTYDGLRMRVGPTSDEELARVIAGGGRRGEIYARLKALRDKYADQIRARYPKIPRRVSGYNLDELLPENGFNVARALVGTECTCVLVLEATTRLIYNPPARALLVLGYEDVFCAADHVVEVLKYEPIGLEGMDDRLIADMKKVGLHKGDDKLLPKGKGWLLAEFGGETKEEADDKARRLMKALEKGDDPPSMKLFDDMKEQKEVWMVREAGLGATAHVPGEKITWEGWEDSAVPPAKLGDYLRDLRKLLERYDYEAGDFYGHFGQGCLHTRIDFDLETKDGIEKYRAYMHDAADLVVGYGGSLSGEHGDGQSRAELLPKMFGEELVEAFREFKSIWDPEWKMNPGKVVNAYRMDENLRIGTNYDPPQWKTHFQFPKDQHSFSRTVLRCVGIGECRRHEQSTMCPSYRVTREEEHSTRGRARLLFEMLQGEVIKGGWKSEEVKGSLDLCMACKGCKGDCPTYVDMATYKAEFLSHYYEGRLRPRHAYAFGLIRRWAQLASLAPRVVNFITQTAPLSSIAKLMSGMAPERQIPAFATQTFKSWFRQREANSGASRSSIGNPQSAGKRVILWPDTFNNHFHPETAQAAVEVLEAAGFHVVVPERNLCCGRPLYDYGMLDLAKRWLRQIIETLREEIRNGTPLVALEPSCAAVFRDELINLFPNDEDAKRLCAQTYLLSEFLEQKAPDFKPLQLARKKAIAHGHCHHKALVKMDAEESVLQKLGLDCETLDSGCCGMAGSFGFEKAHYDTSVKVGELVLLPAVRAAANDTLVIADGFSCREQISQVAKRRTLHLAEVIQMAMREGVAPVEGDETKTPDDKGDAEGRAPTAVQPPELMVTGAG